MKAHVPCTTSVKSPRLVAGLHPANSLPPIAQRAALSHGQAMIGTAAFERTCQVISDSKYSSGSWIEYPPFACGAQSKDSQRVDDIIDCSDKV